MKSKQIIQMIILGLVLVLCIGTYIFLNQKNKENNGTEEEEETTGALISLESSSIAKLSYTYDGEQMDFVYEDGNWYYEADKNFPLDSTYPENIVNTMSNLSAERRLEDNLDNKDEYGLGKPQMTVTATDTDGKETTLYIGDSNESTGNYYCYLKDTQIVYMIDDTLASKLKYKLYDMAKTEDFPSITATSVYELSIGNATYVYCEDGKSEYDYTGYATWFRLNEDGSYTPVNEDTLSGMLSSFTGMSYKSMAEYETDEEKLSKYGFDQPTIIHVKYTDTYEKTESGSETSSDSSEETTEETTAETEILTVEKEFSLLVGNQNEDGDYYVKTQDSDEINVVSGSALDTLLKAEESSLVYTSVFHVKKDFITAIVLKAGTTEFTLMENSELPEANEELYSKLYNMASEQTVSGEFVPETEPELTITYSLNLQEYETVTQKFYVYNGSYYAVDINGETQLLVTKTQVKDIISAIMDAK